MPASVVQSKSAAQNTGLATVTVSWDTPATAGNVLIIAVGSDDYRTVGGIPSGFTESTGCKQEVNLGHYLWWKVAAGGETSTSYTIGSAATSCWITAEISGLTGSPYDVSNGNSQVAAVETYTTPTITPAAGDKFLIASMGYARAFDCTGMDTWVNSFVELQDIFTTLASGTRDQLGVATLSVTANGSTGYSSGATAQGTGTSNSQSGIIIAFTVAAAASSVPYNPQRTVQTRDPGETWWIQRDPRNALTVATAANPLPSPLDVSWQDGGRYWHLYNDIPLRTSQAYFGQKDRRDANLVATAANPLPSPLDSAWQAGSRYWHLYGDAADAAPRTWQSLQRPYVSDPSLLSPPINADPTLLASVENTKRAIVAASHDDRRLYPVQRQVFADIDVVQIVGTGATGAWWGTDDTAYFLYGNLRPRPDPNLLLPPVPFDPTLAGYLPGWIVDNRASLFVDRREVPQQRAYISDPSFYPTIPPTDPLTVAWGAGGTYWLLYNTAALQVDRREVPQQRRYVSDPALLLSALLEDVLLGGADMGRHAMWFTDRREVPWQPPRLDLTPFTAIPADPLLVGAGVGGDRWRRYALPATNVDRREVPWQPPRWTVYVSGLTSSAGQITLITSAGRMGPTTSTARMGPTTSAGRIISTTEG